MKIFEYQAYSDTSFNIVIIDEFIFTEANYDFLLRYR